jgi:arginyl-tRNA synthetase
MENLNQENVNKLKVAFNQIAGVIISFIPSESNVKQIKFSVPHASVIADISYPCHKIAKSLMKSPQGLAEKIAADIKKLNVVADASAQAGFINVKLNWETVLNS